MLLDIKDNIDDPAVRELVSESMWDRSPEAMEKKLAAFRSRKDWYLYGWVESDEILGVCGIEIRPDLFEILNIAVAPNARRRGIGKTMITALQQKHRTAITAETDNDAVGFYRKCGFEIQGFTRRYDTAEYQRYSCVLSPR